MAVKEEYKYSELTGRIIKCAYNVHNILGCGFQEVIYQRCLAIEMEEAGITFSREQEMPLYYKDKIVGERRVDFLVETTVCVEIKAVSVLDNTHLAQAINYLEAFKFEVGLLINFGADRLECKRVMKSIKQLQKGNQISYSDYEGPR